MPWAGFCASGGLIGPDVARPRPCSCASKGCRMARGQRCCGMTLRSIAPFSGDRTSTHRTSTHATAGLGPANLFNSFVQLATSFSSFRRLSLKRALTRRLFPAVHVNPANPGRLRKAGADVDSGVFTSLPSAAANVSGYSGHPGHPGISPPDGGTGKKVFRHAVMHAAQAPLLTRFGLANLSWPRRHLKRSYRIMS